MSTSSRPAGSRQPKHLHLPAGVVRTAGPDAAELAALCGLHLDGAQRDVLDGALGLRGDGTYAARRVVLIQPRQNGKTETIAAAALQAAFLTDARLILWTSHLVATNLESFRGLVGRVEACPDLQAKVKAVSYRNGREQIELLDGTRIMFRARGRGSGRGPSPDVIVFDEAYDLDEAEVEDIAPSKSARPDPQVWWVSSAPHPTSAVLRRVCLAGRTGSDEALFYAEWCADDDADLDDPAAVAQANPALGVRISWEAVADDRAEMTPEGFARERLGIWREVVHVSPIDVAKWTALAAERSDRPERVAFAVDVDPDRELGVIAAAGRRGDGRVEVEVVDAREGKDWIPGRLAGLVERWQPCVVVMDAQSGAVTLLPDLDERGLTLADKRPDTATGALIVETTRRDMARACLGFEDAILDGALAHVEDDRLTAAVESAAKRKIGDLWGWKRAGVAPISPLVAVTLAHWGLVQWGDEQPEKVPSWVMWG